MEHTQAKIIMIIALIGMFAVLASCAQDNLANSSSTLEMGDNNAKAQDNAAESNGNDVKREGNKRDGDRFETVANLIGIDIKTLWAEIKSGKSIAEIAEANNVDPQTTIDVCVTEVKAKIDAATSTGRILAEEAAKKLTAIEKRCTYFVNETAIVLEKDGKEHGNDKRKDDKRNNNKTGKG